MANETYGIPTFSGGSGNKFKLIEADKGNPNKGTGLFFAINQVAVETLEKLTAMEKGLAVPYLKLWQVDPSKGTPAFPLKGTNQPLRPISLQMVEPPSFGSSVDQFRERPAVSIEKMVVKSEAFKGRYSFQTVLLSIVVHRPDALDIGSSRTEEVDDFSALILPGNVIAAEYGWGPAPISNELFNGKGYTDGQIVIPSRKTIYFTIANYTFKIMPDAQIKVEITGYEAGLLNLRKFIIGLKATTIDPNTSKEFRYTQPDRIASKNFYSTKEGIAIIDKTIKKLNSLGSMVTFEKLINEMFAETIIEAFSESGYNKSKIYLRYGKCNKRAGETSPRFGAQDMTDKPIGDFKIPLKLIIETFRSNFKAGEALTVQNFMTPFINIIRQEGSWKRSAKKRKSDGGPNQTVPDVFIKMVPNGDAIGMYIIDAKREFTGLSDEDTENSKVGRNATKRQIQEALNGLGVPKISFLNGHSYIKDANFSVTGDDKIKAHLIQKYLGGDARQENNKPSVVNKTKSVDPKDLLFSASIQGDIVTLGNFAFELFGLVWLEFGVKRWDGPFYVRSHEDVISRGTFETKFSMLASGQDPLGTQRDRKSGLVNNDLKVLGGIDA